MSSGYWERQSVDYIRGGRSAGTHILANGFYQDAPAGRVMGSLTLKIDPTSSSGDERHNRTNRVFILSQW